MSKLKRRDFETPLGSKGEKDLLRGINFYLKHGDAGVEKERERIATKEAAKVNDAQSK